MGATSPNPKYDLQNTYNKFQACDCDDKSDCSCDANCNVCCPIGTVAVTDDCGNIVGCLSPNDAEHFNASQIKCAEGFQKTFNPNTGEFLGCLHPADASALIAQLSPTIDPQPSTPSIERFNLINGTENISNSPITAFTYNMTVEVDRIDTTDPLVIQEGVANPFPTGSFIQGSPVVISSSESSKLITLDFPNTITAGVYNFDIEVVGAGVTKIIPVVLTLS